MRLWFEHGVTAGRAARCLAGVLLVGAAISAPAGVLNGFDLSGALVPESEILRGGPPRDGIPAIDRPAFVPAAQATYLAPDARVLGLVLDGVAKAYPIAILNWHEVVNDRYGQQAVAITFCPLCGSGMAFRAEAGGKALAFGVSGLLYNSDVLLYDRQTSSLWSQIGSQAVTGPMKGRKLEPLPVDHTTWADWRARHPATVVLSPATGHPRDYGADPYAQYVASDQTMFPLSSKSRRFHPKERVLGISIGERHKAYPLVEVERAGGSVRDRLGAAGLLVELDREHRAVRVHDDLGRKLPGVDLFWFAWFAFHPDTEVFVAPQPGAAEPKHAIEGSK